MKNIILFILLADSVLVKAYNDEVKPSTCTDSPLHFFFFNKEERLRKNCRWISKWKTRRCKFDGVDTICPATCNTCDNVVDAELKFRVNINGKTQTKDCTWVAMYDQTRCLIDGIAETCRATCSTNDTKSPTMSPTKSPTMSPTKSPTMSPTEAPVMSPTKSPTLSPTKPPTDSPTQSPISPGTVPTGKACSANADCISNYCDQTTKICYASQQCKAIKHGANTEFDDNHVILIFVGSGFTSLNDWSQKVSTIYSVFEKYEFFKSGVTQFSSFYANQLQSSFCYFNCANIDRLLCCDVSTARSIGNSCFPAGARVQTVVVHNDVKYGGAGYVYDNMATCSINSAAPLVAVHELGHSLFDFYDEYTYISSTPSTSLNCDADSSCPKWNDLINDYPSICSSSGCAGGNYKVGESNSFMKELNYNVGPVLTRYTCCTFYALTGSVPPYCSNFLNKGMGLYAYCNWRGYSSANELSVHGELEKSSITTPGGEKIYITNPVEISLEVNDIEASAFSALNDVTPPQPEILKPGYYDSSLLGEESNDNMLKVIVTFVSGEVKEFYVSKFDEVDVPPSENENVHSVFVKKDQIKIFYNYDEHGDVSSIEVQNTIE